MSIFYLPSKGIADVILLKGGKIITGKVIEDDGLSLKFESAAGGVIKISKNQVDDVILGTDEEIQQKRRVAWHFEKAKYFFDRNNFKEAVNEYQKAISLDHQNADLFNNLGTAYARSGDYQKAILAFQNALRTDPNHQTARTNLAQAYLQAGIYDHAESILRNLILSEPKNKDLYLWLSLAFYKSGQYSECADECQRSIASVSATADIYNIQGSCFAKLGDIDKAINAYNRSLDLLPNESPIRKDLMILVKNLKKEKHES